MPHQAFEDQQETEEVEDELDNMNAFRDSIALALFYRNWQFVRTVYVCEMDMDMCCFVSEENVYACELFVCGSMTVIVSISVFVALW